ncbi:hypothetical protein EP331_05355 [bacterium]|nr:MAG: hypothetical protein EP331_05355 [bacterium]
MTDSYPLLGNSSLVGQLKARQQLTKILEASRLSHAYLITGATGVGKKALALAFAEAIQGISNLTDLGSFAKSRKSSWYAHPDIHMFFPMPREFDFKEFTGRKELLSQDPYDIIDFGLRPSLTGNDLGNKQAFYSIEYYREHIRPSAFFKPNEGTRTIIILSDIEKMRVEMSNAFLKLLEEPNDRVMFIMTTSQVEHLLPTILSRCQIINCAPLSSAEIEEGLMRNESVAQEDAQYVARIAGGNYAITRFYNLDELKRSRELVVDFLRSAYASDAVKLAQFADQFNRDYNTQGQLSVLNMLEVFLRDIHIYKETQEKSLVTNADQLDVIKKFIAAQPAARINDMIKEIDEIRVSIRQNVNSRLSFIVLANRFFALMRGRDVLHPSTEPWTHIPAVTQG